MLGKLKFLLPLDLEVQTLKLKINTNQKLMKINNNSLTENVLVHSCTSCARVDQISQLSLVSVVNNYLRLLMKLSKL